MKFYLAAYLLRGSEQTYILKFGPSRLKMGFVDKRFSRTQGLFFLKIGWIIFFFLKKCFGRVPHDGLMARSAQMA